MNLLVYVLFCGIDMESSPNRFKDWYNSARPENTPLPLDWRKLDESNPFAKLLVLRTLRPDRMIPVYFFLF